MNNIDFDKLIKDFINRRTYKELSVAVIATIQDDELEQAIIDYIETKTRNHRSTLKVVSKMSKGFQMMYSTWILEGEVNNGGFSQFFVNSSGQYADMALQSLKLIGAMEYYEILKKAIEIHWHEKNNSVLQNLYVHGTVDAFVESYKFTSLNACDEVFYKLNRLSELRIRFIRSNPELFVGS